jgi:HD-GYP domain-containing protein (c-di-GMP phosphodiesterase class II)
MAHEMSSTALHQGMDEAPRSLLSKAGPLALPRRLPFLRNRLRRLVIASVGLALICSAVLNVWQSANRYLAEKRDTLVATANVVAGASSKAVRDGDVPLIREALRSIARVPGLVYARAERSDGEWLAEVGGSARLSGDSAFGGSGAEDTSSIYSLLRTRTIQITVPVVNGGEEVGRLVLISEAGDLAARFLGVLATESTGALLAVAIGLFIADRLQRSITRPLAHLAHDMSRIARTQDYSTSVLATSDVETALLASSFNVMMKTIRDAHEAISNREAEIIFRLSSATEMRDNETGGHILRMARLCRLIAEGMQLRDDEIEAIHRVAPLHDVGKIGVPDSIMLKPGKLDPEERSEMENHTIYGYEILRDSDSNLIHLGAEMAWSHHERWDGAGYPRGLKGSEIPLAGRIAAVADVCDALASPRPYKQAWSLEAVRAHLIKNSGTHFDPECVDGLLSRWPDVQRMYEGQEN